MSLPENIASQIDAALADGKEFALAFLPGEDAPLWFRGGEADRKFDISPWLEPFRNRKTVGAACAGFGRIAPIEKASTGLGRYIDSVEKIISRCRTRNGKTVYSRTICGHLPEGLSWGLVAEKYFRQFPDTLRFIYFTPETGGWLGASPEVLIDCDLNHLRFATMAFAGTRRHQDASDADDKGWDDKNIRENRFVIDFLESRLSELGMNVKKSHLRAVTFGPIEHLCCQIEATPVTSVSRDNLLEKVIDAINPTPALCGWPVEEAKRDIAQYEPHRRGCYGGFVGIATPGRYQAFVNLRSLRFDGRPYCMYGGGGITGQSVATDEFEETEMKLSRLIGCLYTKRDALNAKIQENTPKAYATVEGNADDKYNSHKPITTA